MVTNVMNNQVPLCQHCGRPLNLTKSFIAQDGFRYVTCDACKNAIRLEGAAINPEASAFIVQGRLNYNKLNFEDAITCFDEAIKLCPDHHEAYWLKLLAENGIEYQADPYSGKMLPTCHRCSETPLMQQADYLAALKYAPAEIKRNYEENAGIIDAIRAQVFNLAKQGEEYDVFISFKKTDVDIHGNPIMERDAGGVEHERNSADCLTAEKLYSRLTQSKLKVFYSEVSLKNRGGANFEATIFRALDTAKVFILIGSKTEYIESNWVKNEWRRYMRMMSQGKKSPESFVYVYNNYLPKGLNPQITAGNRQALNFNDNDFWTALNAVIQREMIQSSAPMQRRKLQDSKTEALKEVSTALNFKGRDFSTKGVYSVSLQDEGRLELAKKHLASRNFSGASASLERLVVTSPNNAQLHYLRMLAHNGIGNDEEFCQKAIVQPSLIDELDRIIGYCGEKDPTLVTVVTNLTKLFAESVKSSNDVVAEKTFRMLCQCSNVPYVMGMLTQLTESMRTLSHSLFGQKKYEASARIFEGMLNAIGLNDSLSADQKSEQYAEYNYDYAKLYHKARKFAEAAAYYKAAIKYNPNKASYYMQAWKNKYHMAGEADISGANAVRMSGFDRTGVELVLTHSHEGADRNGILYEFLTITIGQASIGNVEVACQMFEYLISVIPNDDIDRNKKYILSFTDVLIQNGQFESAEKYLHELLKITANQCADAYWKLIFVDTKCKNAEELMRYDKVVDISLLENYESAWACGTSSEREYYERFNDEKLRYYERSRENYGFKLLENGKFDEAKKVFVNLLQFERNTRKREHTRYPKVYWGLLLVDTRCRNNVELASKAKRAEFPDSRLVNMGNYKNYNAAYSYLMMDGKEFSYEKTSNVGNLDIPSLLDEEDASAGKAQSNYNAASESYKLSAERRQSELYYDARSKRRKHTGLFALMIFLFIGCIGGGIAGSFYFFSLNISNDWFVVLSANTSIVLGITMGGGAVLGLVIGFFLGGFDPSGALGGAVAGVIAGGIIAGLIYASCWALVPILTIGALIGIGIGLKQYGSKYLKKDIDEINYEDKVYKRARKKVGSNVQQGTLEHKKTATIKSHRVAAIVLSVISVIIIGVCLFSLFNLSLVYAYVHWGIILASAIVFAIAMAVAIFLTCRRIGRIASLSLYVIALGMFAVVLAGPTFNDFEITDKDDINMIANCPYGHYIISDDIDMEGESLPTIDFLLGHIDGQGNRIYNFEHNTGTWIGEHKGVIENIIFDDGSFDSPMIGENKGRLSDVTFSDLRIDVALIAISEGVVRDIELNGIEAYISDTYESVFIDTVQGGEVSGVLAEDVTVTVCTSETYFGTLVGGVYNAEIQQLGLRNATIMLNNSDIYKMGGLVGRLDANLSQAFVENIRFDLQENTGYDADRAAVGGMIGHASSYTISDSYCYGVSFTGEWSGRLSVFIGAAGSVNILNVYSHYNITNTDVDLGDTDITGLMGIVDENCEANVYYAWYNAESAAYTYRGSLFGNGASELNRTNCYGNDNFSITDGRIAMARLALDGEIWKASYGSRPRLAWYTQKN